jgi:tripartite-type tricarboxylate transporter receptor subunit TctC
MTISACRPTRRSVLALGASALASPALSQSPFPSRPIRMIVPWPAGGTTDIQMRALCEIAARRLGQTIVIDNRSGLGGTLGAQTLATEAAPDGYTLSQMPNSVFRIPVMMERPTYRPLDDFTWIIRLVGYTFGIVVRADKPWRTLADLLDHARARPGEVTYGTPGVGTLDVTMERVAELAGGIRWTHVPFRGSAPNIQALLGGHIDCSGESSLWADLVRDGRLRLLATWGAERARRFPDAPTLRESGIDVVAPSPYGIAGPRGMDPGVVRMLHDAFKAALDDPSHRALLERYDMSVEYLDGPGYAAYAREFYETDSVMVRRMGLRM